MPTITAEALCIRHWDWSETSQTVSLFTRDHGLIRALAKGAKRDNAPFSGGVELLTRGHAVAIVKPSSELATLTSWDLAELFPGIRTRLRTFYAGMYIADLLQRLVHDSDPHPGMFDAALTSLRALSDNADPDACLAFAQWWLIADAGYKPNLELPSTPEPLPMTYTFAPRSGGLVASPPPDRSPAWGVRSTTVLRLRELDNAGPRAAIPPTSESLTRAARLLAGYLRELLGTGLPSQDLVFGGPRPG